MALPAGCGEDLSEINATDETGAAAVPGAVPGESNREGLLGRRLG